MGISLEKGQRINLSKESPAVTAFTVGLGWDPRASDNAEFDLDASALLLDADGNPFQSEKGLVFYGQPGSECGGVTSTGDNRTGEGDGDDEQLILDMTKLDAGVERIIVFATIHEAKSRNQNFGMVDNAFIRIEPQDGGDEIARYDLTEDFSTEITVVLGEFYKKDGEMRFAAKGEGFSGDLGDFLSQYGLNVG